MIPLVYGRVNKRIYPLGGIMFCKRMIVLFSILLCYGITAFAATNGSPIPTVVQGSSIKWNTNFNAAVSQAKQANKYILLFFTGSDWCGWCKKLDNEVFSTSEFANTVGNQFVFVELDFPMGQKPSSEVEKQNADLKKKFGVTGFPTVVILDSAQNFVAETGYRSGGGKAYADYLLGLLK